MSHKEASHIPTATYRVQLHGKSTFRDLGSRAGYFRGLGISDMYLSPIFTSVPGSTHGYDVTDYSEINPELGGEKGFEEFAQVLRDSKCGIILDFVPNHMGIAGVLNEWWRDVLKRGPSSKHAPFFDIQWKAEYPQSHPRVLVPILHDHYGRVLESGEITLVYEDGIAIRYRDTLLPIRPTTYRELLEEMGMAGWQRGDGRPLPDSLHRFFEPSTDTDIPNQEDPFAELGPRLSEYPDLRERLTEEVKRFNGKPGDSASFDRIHQILEAQHYRLARWQAGAHEINYRRFFAIDTLVGLHMENPQVFRECHALLGRLIARGDVAGLRIDHIDGLRQPEDYLTRIQALPKPEAQKPLYLLVEKIVEGQEPLLPSWPVHGTTGYEFISEMAGILIDNRSESLFDDIYRKSTGETRKYPERLLSSKRLIISEMFANAVSNLGSELVQIVANDRLWRDLTRHELTTAVSELAAHLPVYRTYRRRLEAASEHDAKVWEEACSGAIADNPRANPQPFEFVRDLLIGRYPSQFADPGYRGLVLNWVLTFQQYTGAIMAKSVEDTLFYNFNRFVALNEVGCDPAQFGSSAYEFHSINSRRAKDTPCALLTTSTHDSKFSEDVRARLYALSELPGEWEEWVRLWQQSTSRHTTVEGGHTMPDSSDQYRFFQVLIGAWPLAPGEVDDSFRLRLKEYFRKAVNEAKRHTSILNNNEAYLAACDSFVDGVVTKAAGNDFLVAFEPCAARIARLGMVNSLVQLVLKCTLPGIPDFYQGNEIWDLSLVDPDNRRPVDFELRGSLMESASQAPLATLLEEWRDGRIKIRVMRDLLLLRSAVPLLFSRGSYVPVQPAGSLCDNAVAFRREDGDEMLLVVVPRLVAKVGIPPIGAVWDDTRLEFSGTPVPWKDVITGRTFPPGESLHLRMLFADLPFAVLRARY
ncbi:MAG TPA: malto-oligosyltrehalose synthase [Opitutaceae bacterium]|jgi:(1->4)-alpha-D-glucan 1-alpha-D-glucosylmutase|nr:malto-oligosyltrehalose synthase [Opitutaceae bacterium]